MNGEVSEWFKEHAWKACVGETLPWVRIPPSPPFICKQRRRGARVADRDGLENRCARKGTVGSNPTLSAIHFSVRHNLYDPELATICVVEATRSIHIQCFDRAPTLR